jgi:hypothetical protein
MQWARVGIGRIGICCAEHNHFLGENYVQVGQGDRKLLYAI